MDSNAAQFARIGFPWISEADRAEMPVSIASRRLCKAGPKLAKVKPEFREAGYIARALTAEEERAKRHRAMLAEVRRCQRSAKVAWIMHPGETALISAETLVQAPSEAAERIANRERLEAEFQAEQLRKQQEVAARRAAHKAEQDAERFAALAAVMAVAMGDS